MLFFWSLVCAAFVLCAGLGDGKGLSCRVGACIVRGSVLPRHIWSVIKAGLREDAFAAPAAEVVGDGVEWEPRLVLYCGLSMAGQISSCGGKVVVFFLGGGI